MFDQINWIRPSKKFPEGMKEYQKNKILELTPIEEKESYNWLKAMKSTLENLPSEVKVLHIGDRGGDFYEFIDACIENKTSFLVRAAYNRKLINSGYSFDKIKDSDIKGYADIDIPRDSRNNNKPYKTKMAIKYLNIDIIKPRNKTGKTESANVNLIYVYEVTPKENKAPIEWFLMTDDIIDSTKTAFKYVQYYVQRWKIERFHYVLKSGCNIEKIELRSADKLSKAALIYSIIAVKIMNLTYIARVEPEKMCDTALEETEWKTLYCIANKTSIEPNLPYSIKEAVNYLGLIGGYKRAPSDGPPGLEVIWNGILKLKAFLEYKQYFN